MIRVCQPLLQPLSCLAFAFVFPLPERVQQLLPLQLDGPLPCCGFCCDSCCFGSCSCSCSCSADCVFEPVHLQPATALSPPQNAQHQMLVRAMALVAEEVVAAAATAGALQPAEAAGLEGVALDARCRNPLHQRWQLVYLVLLPFRGFHLHLLSGLLAASLGSLGAAPKESPDRQSRPARHRLPVARGRLAGHGQQQHQRSSPQLLLASVEPVRLLLALPVE
mmetsp:Transcript_89616/g.159101  ORF Transcript_89616/g.159101 Transcript_89616/m.159101 type:complete len:222 (+) Transcript_89616:2819-3484(+)